MGHAGANRNDKVDLLAKRGCVGKVVNLIAHVMHMGMCAQQFFFLCCAFFLQTHIRQAGGNASSINAKGMLRLWSFF